MPSGFPSITVPTSTSVVEIGHAVVLLCGASGNPPPRIRWVRDYMPLDIRSNHRYTLLEGNMPGENRIIQALYVYLNRVQIPYIFSLEKIKSVEKNRTSFQRESFFRLCVIININWRVCIYRMFRPAAAALTNEPRQVRC